MSMLARTGWTLWALVPVAVIAFHFGPGQELAAREQASNRFTEAVVLEHRAIEAQALAYETHLMAIEARRRAFLEDGTQPDAEAALEDALAREREAYDLAANHWEVAADAYEQVEEQLGASDARLLRSVRWSKARARVRSGAVWDGASELEELLFEFSEMDAIPADDAENDEDLERATREELAVAYYFGARLMREAGEPALEWKAQAVQARQHFRYLAEEAARSGADRQFVRGLENNVERTIDLEQMDKSELEARPLPRQSPRAARGSRPGQGRPGISQRPPQRRDGRGAGGAGPIGPGW